MVRTDRRLIAAIAAVSLLLFVAGRVTAQPVFAAPSGVACYYPPATVAYYTPPATVAYYTPPTTIAYYTPPAVVAPAPAVSYYGASVSYYTPSVSYYSAPAAVTTTYYGLFGRPRLSTTYYSPVYVGR